MPLPPAPPERDDPQPQLVPPDPRRGRRRREIGGIILLLVAVFLAGALAFERSTVGATCAAAAGVFGPVGSCMRSWLMAAIGGPAVALLPLLPAVHGLRLLGRIAERPDRSWLVCLVGAVALVPVAVGLGRGAPIAVDAWAGLWGNFAAYYLSAAVGRAGAWIVVLLAASALTAWTLWWNPVRLVIGGRHGARAPDVVAAHGLFVLLAHRERLRAAVVAFAAVLVAGIPFWLTDLALAGRFDVGVGGGGRQLGGPSAVANFAWQVAGDFSSGRRWLLILVLALAAVGAMSVPWETLALALSLAAVPAIAFLGARLHTDVGVADLLVPEI